MEVRRDRLGISQQDTGNQDLPSILKSRYLFCTSAEGDLETFGGGSICEGVRSFRSATWHRNGLPRLPPSRVRTGMDALFGYGFQQDRIFFLQLEVVSGSGTWSSDTDFEFSSQTKSRRAAHSSSWCQCQTLLDESLDSSFLEIFLFTRKLGRTFCITSFGSASMVWGLVGGGIL